MTESRQSNSAEAPAMDASSMGGEDPRSVAPEEATNAQLVAMLDRWAEKNEAVPERIRIDPISFDHGIRLLREAAKRLEVIR